MGTDVSQERAEGLRNVTHLFHLWFVIGFVIKCIGVAHGVMNFLVPMDMRSVTGPVTVLAFLALSSSLAHTIWGSVLRWSNYGKACSGDFYIGNEIQPEPYLWDSAYVMQLYLYIVIGLISFCCCCVCCVGCCVGMAAANG